MIDLNKMVEFFLGEAVWQCRHEGEKEDEAVVRFLNARNESRDVRRTEVLKWLRYYGVLQGLNEADRKAVASVIVDFADARGSLVTQLSDVEIIERFNDLHHRCRTRVHLTKDQTPRRLTSLASKALWCCYPNAIPLFDAYARRALWVISHLVNLGRPAGNQEHEYARFVSVWLDLYRRVEPAISNDRLDGYPYKVRVFDRILWIIGEPDYGVKMRQP